MRVGRPAANLYNNLRVTSAARTAASLITASRDPPGTLGLFLGTIANSLVTNIEQHMHGAASLDTTLPACARMYTSKITRNSRVRRHS